MDTGNDVYISKESVRDALDNLVRPSAQSTPNALCFLLLIDVYLATETFLPPRSDTRSLALAQILTRLITKQYFHHRSMIGLLAFSAEVTLDQTLEIINVEAQQGGTELLCWSWLYYHYIRVDLGLGLQLFCTAAHIEERTLRRYQLHGVERLTELILSEEESVQREQRKLKIYSQLPTTAFAPFVGRGDVIDHIENLFTTHRTPHIQISGAAGIGKSALVSFLLRRWGDDNRINHLIWIERPRSVQHVRRYLREQLLADESSLTLRDYCALQRKPPVVVLEDCQALFENMSDLEALMTELSAACVFMTSQFYIFLAQSIHFPLGELSEREVYSFLDCLFQYKGQPLQPAVAASIWENMGGNPLLVTAAFHQWPLFNIHSLSIDFLFSQSYAAMAEDLKRAWIVFLLLPPRPYSPDKVLEIWPEKVLVSQLKQLMTQHLLEVVEEGSQIKCALTTSGRRFLEAQCQTDDETRRIVSELIEDLQLRSEQSRFMATMEVVEQILLSMSSPLTLNDETRRQWVLYGHSYGIRQGHYSQWSMILEPYFQGEIALDDFDLCAAYGVCLRYLSQWEKAQEVFERLVLFTGRAGQFLNQARVLLEWSILLRCQGKYKRAAELLAHAEGILSHEYDEQLFYTLNMEYAQVALDSGDVGQVEHILTCLPKDRYTLLLQCEVYAVKKDYQSLGRLLVEIEPEFQGEPRYLARLYALYGISDQWQNNPQLARQNLEAALTLLESQNDLLAQARVRSNLGSVLMLCGNFQDARMLLKQAEKMQATFQDQVGLFATQHNLRLLSQMIIR